MLLSRCSGSSTSRKTGGSKNDSKRQLLCFLALFLSVSILQIQPSHAYANWLKCYIELEDEEEVIMHKPIVRAADQSEEQKAFIEIQPYVSSRNAPWMASTQQEHHDLFPPSDAATTTSTALLKLRLKVPQSMRRQDIQFVMEATGEGVSFVGPGVMCDGIRAFSRQYDAEVLLQINSTSTQTAEDPDQPASSSALLGDIELIAGWAAGYEAVKLTPKLILRRSGPGKEDDDDGDDGDKGGEL